MSLLLRDFNFYACSLMYMISFNLLFSQLFSLLMLISLFSCC